ncbi:hypothetical protein OIE49_29465 [Streptomyces sp. NBC_01788]|uniref:hypothetical protein n=1 Tax=Streptomyces sp. NBC_01788 TaxID=2975940 RepID=UPI002DD9478C|nr:hypothetical protein [Streptomyces sp. NBC_01788]WSB29683.1 hypothetical protein OIE49_29465 [Streptomyces sp. NBC_01788]
MNSVHPALATFRLVRDHDVSGISGEGVVAEGVQFSDGWVVTHWLDQPPMHEPKTDVWHHKGTHPITKIHGHNGATRIAWADEEAARRRQELAYAVAMFDIPAAVMGTEAARAALRRQISHAIQSVQDGQAAPVEAGDERIVGAVMPAVDALLGARDRALQVVARAYALADRWKDAHGSAMCLVRAAGAELQEALDNARDELDGDAGEGYAAAASGPLPPAAECSAQHHWFDDGRLCIRAAQHRGDHIDEQGYHWSDTAAVYPLADGTLRESPAAAVRRGQEYVSSRYGEPEPQHDRPESSCSNPDHACTKCGDCAYEHPGQGGCACGHLPPAEGRSVRTACTGGTEDLTKAERIRALDTAVAELAQALRLTREYVGEDVLPAVEGWSWYDALRRHAPHELAAADEAYADTIAGQLASLKKKIADALAEGLAETVQRAAQAEATIKRVRAMAEAWERMPQGRYVYIHEAARGVRIALAGAEQPATAPICRDCPHCPDGHQPPTSGSQPWGVWVGPARDGDGQPTTIHVARSAGAHVAETDAEWMRHVLNHQPDPETLCRLPHETEG